MLTLCIQAPLLLQEPLVYVLLLVDSDSDLRVEKSLLNGIPGNGVHIDDVFFYGIHVDGTLGLIEVGVDGSRVVVILVNGSIVVALLNDAQGLDPVLHSLNRVGDATLNALQHIVIVLFLLVL